MKKGLSVVLCFSVLFLLFGCQSTAPSIRELPTLRVSYQDTEIKAVRGTYSWTIKKLFSSQTTHADTIGPTESVKNSTPLIVPPKSSLTLNFDYRPVNMEVSIWNNNLPEKQDIVNGKIEVPDSKGDFVYLVDGHFEEGTVSYVFKVSINNTDTLKKHVENIFSKNDTKVEFKDVTVEVPNYYETIVGGLKDGGCYIHIMEGGANINYYQLYFKKWKPYSNITILNTDTTIKINYEEKTTDHISDSIISFSLPSGNKKVVELYKDGKLVQSNIKQGYGIE